MNPDVNGRKRELLTDSLSHFSCRHFSWFQKSCQNYHSRSLCEQYTIRQGFSLQVPVYKCVYIALKRIHLMVHFGYEYIFHADHATLLRLTETGKLLIFVSTFRPQSPSRETGQPFRGGSRKFRKGWPGHFQASYIFTLSFSENCIEIIKISNKKGGPRSRRSSPKSVLFSQNIIILFVIPPKFCISIFSISLGHEAFVSPKRN